MRQLSENEWKAWLKDKENYHILQSPEWGALKEKFGWSTLRLVDNGTGVQVLFRKLPFGFKIAYIPKGPIGKPTLQFWENVDKFCKAKKSIFLKIEPDLWEGQDSQNNFKNDQAFQPAKSIQPQRTIVVELDGSEETWLSRMKQKTRYNIKLAEKKDVRIIESDDIEKFYEIMISTGNRDHFGIHSKLYYTNAYEQFRKENKVVLLIAYYQDLPLAGLMAFREGNRAWYFYGASNELERNRMPTYLIQLEAMRWASKNGCNEYDLWGIPDEDDEILENEFMSRSDGLWGVYRFKRGFGGKIKRYESAYDRIYISSLYKLFCLYSKRRSVF